MYLRIVKCLKLRLVNLKTCFTRNAGKILALHPGYFHRDLQKDILQMADSPLNSDDKRLHLETAMLRFFCRYGS